MSIPLIAMFVLVALGLFWAVGMLFHEIDPYLMPSKVKYVDAIFSALLTLATFWSGYHLQIHWILWVVTLSLGYLTYVKAEEIHKWAQKNAPNWMDHRCRHCGNYRWQRCRSNDELCNPPVRLRQPGE